MTRPLSTPIANATNQPVINRALLVELFFSGSTVRYWSGDGKATFNGNTYWGVGEAGQVSAIEEGNTIVSKGLTLSLSGVPSDQLALAYEVSSSYRNRPVKVHLAFFDPATKGLLGTDTIFIGRMDTMAITEGEEASEITVQCENHLFDLTRPRIRRYTDQDQRGEYPGDLGMQYIPSVQDAVVTWGRASSVTGGTRYVGGSSDAGTNNAAIIYNMSRGVVTIPNNGGYGGNYENPIGPSYPMPGGPEYPNDDVLN